MMATPFQYGLSRPLQAADSMSLAISHLSFEHHRNVAMGIGEPRPRISWRFEGNVANWTQKGYMVQIQNHTSHENATFMFESSDSVLVPWPTVALSSAEAASVRVRAFGTSLVYEHEVRIDTTWSDAETVETGLLQERDWAGTMMIAQDKAVNNDAPHQPILLRKDFSLKPNCTVARARLYITAYGLYEAHINGQRVGDAVLAPGWQSYHYRHLYQTYDVTKLLAQGDNAIGIQVGEGWYSGMVGTGDGNRNVWGDTLGGMALLTIAYADGSSERIPTDTSWKAGNGAILTSEIYNGEKYDSRLEETGWTKPGFHPTEEKLWLGVKPLDPPFSRLRAPDGPPIRRIEEMKLKRVIKSPSGKTVLDFGQNLVGWLKLKVSGPEGTVIEMTHAEVMVNGEIATRPLREATQADRLILNGRGFQQWEPKFTYHGFRYVQVEGWPDNVTTLDNSSVVAIVVHSDMEQTGWFECSDSQLNKLHENVRWSMKGNFMGIPTDCPQRDERLGWTGDAHAFSPTANFLYDTAGLWREWLRDVRSEQTLHDGIVPVVVPTVPGTNGTLTASAIWGDAIVAVPWNAYTTFGDRGMLAEQYVGAKAWLDTGIPRNDAGLWIHTPQFGDWLDPLAPFDDPGQATTDSTYVADTYLIYVTDLVAKMASYLGYDDDASKYAAQARALRTEFQDAWIDGQGLVWNETQTGLALPLYFDLFPDSEQSMAAARRLQHIIEKNGYLVGTGFAGTHLLGLALSKYNLTESFYRMLLQTTVPSWLYQVVMGATTTWERWDSLLPDGSLNPGEMTSFNHYAVGSVANWMHQVIGGLGPAEPAWKTIKIRPVPGGNVTWATAKYLSPHGLVSTAWKTGSRGFRLDITVPPNAKAEVTLPGSDEVKVVGSGDYSFTGSSNPSIP